MIDQNHNTAPDNNHADEILRQQEFGVKLREAREAAGLSIVDVSEALKLKEEIIKALENSQIEKLPVSAFTQGYIRSYCRLLKLPAEELIELYNKIKPQQEVPLVQTSDISVQRTSGDGGVKIVTMSLVAVGIVLVLAWWFQSDIGHQVSDQSVVTEVTDDSVVDNTNVEQGFVTEIEDQQIIAEQPVENVEPVIPVIEEQVKPAKPEQKKIIAETETKTVAATPAPTRQILPGDDVLMIRSNADSWTEIEDANDQRLLFQLVKAGDFHQLQGRAPFRIFLGNAPFVEVVVNDQPIDLSAHIRQNNIAHVSIKANATVRTVNGLAR
ncbi:MAG TPA: RodZ domain-containing protein, partial [Gammaproteobacteria bacterium]